MEVIAKSQMEMNAIIAERRISSALSRKIPQYADHIDRIGEKALALSENYNYWIGPFIATYIGGRTTSA